MPLTFSCPACGKELSAPDTAAGSKGACKFCHASLVAPLSQGQGATLVTPSAGPAAPPPAAPPIQPPAGYGTAGTPFTPPSYNPPPYAPPGPAPGYGGPPYGGYAGQAMPHPDANTALIYAIVGFFCCGIVLGPIAISKALKVRAEIAANPSYSGGGVATAALVIGLIDVLGFFLLLFGNLARLSSGLPQ